MSYAPKKVFILKNNEYKEITYKEFCALRDADETFNEKCFIPVQGMLLEVSKKVYKDFYRNYERARYLSKLNKKFDIIPLETADNLNVSATNNRVENEVADVVDTISNRIIVDKLYKCLDTLNEEDKNLIKSIYFVGMTEREIAEVQGVSQVAIHKRKHRILRKMKKFIEN